MEEIKKMLRAVINGQSGLRQELMGEMGKIRKDLDELDEKSEEMKVAINQRLDAIGSQLAYLEDDEPTREEFEKLEKKVGKISKRASVV